MAASVLPNVFSRLTSLTAVTRPLAFVRIQAAIVSPLFSSVAPTTAALVLVLAAIAAKVRPSIDGLTEAPISTTEGS